ncbi:7776_t:CDS:2 [Funneliformis geosporum]|uniref:7776_t:CDS:1 n=1 Tax=Funneliformis geosporum TaxID=1117311 RepID=A0A9W4SYJ2_9GLOM|nr:7776_t:CDS:2 [Funneliformis geosporum]
MNSQNSTIHIGTFGRISYVDPKKLLDLKFKYEKASDIYSYGVLIKGDLVLLRLFIIDGYRENVIEETPENYKELYEKCWNFIPKVLKKF